MFRQVQRPPTNRNRSYEIKICPMFSPTHSATLSLLLVFRTNSAYDRFYEGKQLVGVLSNQLRQIVLNSYSFLAIHEDQNLAQSQNREYDIHSPAQVQRLRERIRRMVGIIYGLTRQKLREARIGFLPNSDLGGVRLSTQTWFFDQTRPRLIDLLTPREICHFSRVLEGTRHNKKGARVKFKDAHDKEYTTGIIERVYDIDNGPSYDIKDAHTGIVFFGVEARYVHPILSSKNTIEAAGSRVVIASQKLLDLTQRLTAYLFFGKSFAEAVTRNMQDFLDATSACQRIVDTPLPFLYSHMLSLLLFIFVYSTPFIYTLPSHSDIDSLAQADADIEDLIRGNEDRKCSSLGWLPSTLLVVAYYGIEQIAVLIENPFNFEDIDHDLEAFGRRVDDESRAIALQANNGEDTDVNVVSYWNLHEDGRAANPSRKKPSVSARSLNQLKTLIDNGELSPAELAKIDKDQDGIIDSEEIQEYLEKTGRSPVNKGDDLFSVICRGLGGDDAAAP